MSKRHSEERFEADIEQALLDQGYQPGSNSEFDKSLALEPAQVLAFIQRTQPLVWQTLEKIHKDKTAAIVLDGLTKELAIKGMLKVLRQGFKVYGKKFRVALFAPNNQKNPASWDLYHKNRLSVTRQLYYSEANKNSLDMVLFLNGLPIATLELKSRLPGGWSTEQAKQQYKQDRDHRELLFEFKKRTLVHFGVDEDQVIMTTRLSGYKTFFLPFNRGSHPGEKACGAGNPTVEDDYKTAYLWREVLGPDSLLDILGRFMHLQVDDKRILKDGKIQKITREAMIFPRYHQLQVVRNLVSHSQQNGAGHNYLVQHSAGSGKSNSIAWLAHRLSNLHNADDERVFNSVIVITDRRVLDQQLQKTIFQFDHKHGVVQKIDEDTRQLVQALSDGTPIIISTLQKFPFVAETLDKLNQKSAQANKDHPDLAISTQGKRFAVIVDEAHSSQSGESAMDLKGVLNRDGIQEAAAQYAAEQGLDLDADEALPENDQGRMEDEQDRMEEVVRCLMKRGKQPNLSFFAFTATPKYKTLKVFDEPGPNGEAPFHHYSMRQAIEERFIHDVLKHYTTFTTYFRLTQDTEDDPHVERKKAAKALARFLDLHAYNLGQKTEVMVEHFRTHVRHKIGGRAKAMVVTGSRLHAVRYKQEFDRYISNKGYTDVRSLVAFSGSVTDPDCPDKSWTETGMNGGIKESELPERFDSDDFQVLLVAEKYQTGFDQPLLHTMYVDKKLSGIQAVQTLSRLNRTSTGKEDTFVLDFRNTEEEIYEAFKPYYDQTEADDLTDPQHLYRLQHQIEETRVLRNEEIEAFCQVYFLPKRKESKHDHARMNAILDKAIERFKELPEDEQADCKGLCVNFRNMYGFLSQVIPYQDSDLEQWYSYLRFLLNKLPRNESGPAYKLDDDVELEYYRLQKISEGQIDLKSGDSDRIGGPDEVGTGRSEEEYVPLSELVEQLNVRFGTHFTEADQLFFDQIQQEAIENADLREAAQANTEDDFRYVFEKTFEGLIIDRMDDNEEIFGRLMADPEFRQLATDDLISKIYRALRRKGKQHAGPA